MKFVFLVQGEGRGHMTQAITLCRMLQQHGHEVSTVIIGKSERRVLPKFVFKEIQAPIIQLDSPNFVTDKKAKTINLPKTIAYNALRIKTFKQSLEQIHEIIQADQPDVLLNFYDFLGGLYCWLYKPDLKYYCIGHQYLASHPDFIFAEKRHIQRWLFLLNNEITALRADKRIALSFQSYHPSRINKLIVVPPLIRSEVKKQKVSKEDFYLCYMVNAGYAEEVITWQKAHQDVNIICFWDNKAFPKVYQPQPNLTFHQVDDQLFLEKMAACKAYVSTAGFESICEAMYLQKPVMMIPVKGQYEQACNALDAVSAGAGIAHDQFDFSQLTHHIDTKSNKHLGFLNWEGKAEAIILHVLTGQYIPLPSEVSLRVAD